MIDRSKNGLIDVACELRHETERAYLIDTGEGEMWVPKSQVEYYKEGSLEIVTMPMWLAKEKGFI
jgi:hypothetical protein